MDGNQPTYPDAAQRIMALVKQTFGDIFNLYVIGLPDDLIIPTDAFPCVIVDKTDGTYTIGATTSDDITESVRVHVFVDTKTGLGSPDNDDTVKRQLQTLIEGRDPNTGLLLPTSLMYAIRTHLTLSSKVVPGAATINNDVRIMYEAAKRPNMPETREAIVQITVTERLDIPERSGAYGN